MSLEALEPRWMLSGPEATLQALDVPLAGVPSHLFRVTYTDDVAINTATIDDADVRVTGPDGFDAQATLLSVWGHNPAKPVQAVYRVAAPGGFWDAADDGTYAVEMQADQVADNEGTCVPAGILGTFQVDVGDPGDREAPTAVATIADVTSAGGITQTLTVTYSDNVAIRVSELDGDDVYITGPSFRVRPTLVGVDDDSDGPVRTATYEFTPPAGSWDSSDNGSYDVWMHPFQVNDTNHNSVPAGFLTTFSVDIDPPPDTTPPTAETDPADVLIPDVPVHVLRVAYRDTDQINRSTLGNENIRVTGPNGYDEPASLMTVTGSGSRLVATYRVNPPGEVWQAVDDGTYHVMMQAGQVADAAGNTVPAGELATFQVSLGSRPDLRPPQATVAVQNITEVTAAANQIEVTFTDESGVDVSTLGDRDLRVIGHAGDLDVVLISVDPNSDGSPRVATYEVSSPGSDWDEADNGAYQIWIQPGQVADVLDNVMPAELLGTFVVAIGDADTTAPEAELLARDTLTGGGAFITFQVRYTDDTGLLMSSLDDGDLRVTGPNGYDEPAELVYALPTGASTAEVRASYRTAAPGGTWDAADNGSYTVVMQAGQASDLAGNPVPAGELGTLTVDVGAARDRQAPTAVLTVADVEAASGDPRTLTVVYADNTAIDVGELDSRDLRVSGPGVALRAEFVSVDERDDGTPRTATYRIMAPGGSWDSADNGSYDIWMAPLQVSDTSGNYVPAGKLGSFSVSILDPDDTIAPTATLASQGPVFRGATSHTLRVQYSDASGVNRSTIGDGDLHVLGPNQFDEPVKLIHVFGAPHDVSAVYQLRAPGGAWDAADNGTYRIMMRADQVYDVAGNPVGASELGTFEVDLGGLSDLQPPRAQLTADSVTDTGGATHTLTVTYSDNVAVDISDLDKYDLRVLGAHQVLETSFTSVDVDTDGTPRSATYEVKAPGGTWTADDNGTYQVWLQPFQVSDTNENSAPLSLLGTFAVSIGVDPDTTAPQAELVATDRGVAGTSFRTFQVVYSDNGAIDLSSIDSADLQVTGPNEFQQAATLLWVVPEGSGTERVRAGYRVSAPGGVWDDADRGTYEILMQADQVLDTSSNAVAAGVIGSFEIGAGTDADTTPPTAELQADTLTTAGAATHAIHVVYVDDEAVDVSDLDSQDLRVKGPGRFLRRASFVSVDDATDDATRIATYQISAPDGTWDEEDNGTYEVWLMPWQVSDTSQNYARFQRLGTFTVDIGQTGSGGEGESRAYTVTVSDDRFEFDGGDVRLKAGRSIRDAGTTLDLTVTVRSPDEDGATDFTVSVQTNPWQNQARPLDVDGDGHVVPRDALQIINRLNASGAGALRLVAVGAVADGPLVDANGDHHLTPLDALLVINSLNRGADDGGEGESGTKTAAMIAATPLVVAPASDPPEVVPPEAATVQAVRQLGNPSATEPLPTGFYSPTTALAYELTDVDPLASEPEDSWSELLDRLASELVRRGWWNR